MAVKVMVAPAIATAAIAKRALAARRDGTAPAKPKRRRSSVYDADGNEVFITLVCLKCHKMRPLSLFGLRKMADGAIRNQPWCRTCRSGSGAEKAGEKARRAAEDAESSAASVPASTPEPAEREAAARRPSSSVAAEVAAALAAGMRR